MARGDGRPEVDGAIPLRAAAGLCSLDEAHEKRMWPHRARQKLRVELAANHVRMVRDFGDFHETAIRRKTREDHSGVLELLTVGVIELEPVPVALFNLVGPIDLGSLDFRAATRMGTIPGASCRPCR